MADSYDMIIVGTGWHGLSAAKVYIELHPNEKIVLLESEDGVGGTWGAKRIYPGLKSNNLWDAYNHPDFPMPTEVYGVNPNEHIPGAVLNRYLNDLAKKFGIYSRIRFNTEVETIEATDAGYRVHTINGQDLETKKIIVATGLTSQPNFPQYPGKESFGAPYFHAKDFLANEGTLKTTESVVVVGAGKSAFDVAYAYAEAGVHVDMVIRKNGKGPVYISKPWVMDGSKRLEYAISTRWMTQFSPCPFGGVDGWGWIRKFLHGTWIGRFIVDKFWAGLGGEVLEVNNYAGHPETKKLQPYDSAFWIASGLSILNFDGDFFDLVRKGKINVHSADIESLADKAVHLNDGTDLKADALICATGWLKDSGIKFVNFGPGGIGLPQSKEEQTRLAEKADQELLNMYPRLKNQPPMSFVSSGEPFRLYRFIVPLSKLEERNIAFAGMVSTVCTTNVANTQALWISAFLDGKLDRLPTTQEATRETMLHTQWGHHRYPYGYTNFPDLAFDSIPLVDLMLSDLGLTVNRKAGMYADLTDPYTPRDYAGLVDEWIEKHPAKR